MRLSNVQKEVLRGLFEITAGETARAPVGAIALFILLNQGRARPIAVTEFRRCCQKLLSVGLIEHFRDPHSSKLALCLTASGITQARSLYQPRQEAD